MAKSKFYFFSSLIVVSVLAFTLGTTVFSPTTVTTSSSDNDASISYHARVCISKNGQLIECKKNTFTETGMNHTMDYLAYSADAVKANIDDIALANSSNSFCLDETAGDGLDEEITTESEYLCSEWTSCGLTRASADWVHNNGTAGTAGNWSISKEFTYTCDAANAVVNTTGLYNSTANSSKSRLFAATTFTDATLQQNDKINVTWYVWVT